jgi:hypothetical protein
MVNHGIFGKIERQYLFPATRLVIYPFVAQFSSLRFFQEWLSSRQKFLLDGQVACCGIGKSNLSILVEFP